MIEFNQVGMRYGAGVLLRDVTMRLQPGSFHFLTGPSGSGKTTLIRLCNLENQPSEGRIKLFGDDSAGLDRNAIARLRRRIGLVHQDCKFIDHLPLHENVTLPLTVAGRDVNAARDDLNELLTWVGLAHRTDSLPPELSGGERQRAALARAVIQSPDVVLADEPTGNVDWDMSLRILDLLVELNRLGKTILCATHDMNLIRQAKTKVSARVLRIQDNTVQLAGADL